jgi:hypothetical protein
MSHKAHHARRRGVVRRHSTSEAAEQRRETARRRGWREGRRPRRTRNESNQCRTQRRESGPNGLERVREVAKEGQEGAVHRPAASCDGRSAPGQLLRSLKKKAAPGVDGVTWQAVWRRPGEARIADLKGRIHRGAYQAQPSRRVWITENRWAAAAIGDRGAGGQNRSARERKRYSTG